MQIRKLSDLVPIHSLKSPGYYVAYPRLIGRKAMPDDVFAISDPQWGRGYFPESMVNFYRLTNVIVAEQGLVFDSSGTLYEETRRFHGDDSILAALEAIGASGITSPKMARYSRAVLCKQRGAENYGHWLIEMLPKAFFAKKELGLGNYLYAVPKAEGIADVVRDSLEMVGVGQENHLLLDRTPSFFHELIVIEGLTVHSIYMSPLLIECLEHLSAGIAGNGPARVYLRRAPAKSRDFETEDRIAERLAMHGFRPVEMMSLSLREKIAAVKDARVVLGTLGAAMTNVAFCRPGTEVCVFSPASAREFFFWLLSNLKHHTYYEIRCPELGPALGPLPWDRKIASSPEEIEDFLSLLWEIQTQSA